MRILIRYELPGTTYQRRRQGDSEVDKIQSPTGKKSTRDLFAIRIIYDIHDDRVEVIVLEIEGHYNDK